jgi:hypothetical protein
MVPVVDGPLWLWVTATNTGRIAAQIKAWGFHLRNETTGAETDSTFPDDQSLPVELAPQGSSHFNCDKRVLVQGMKERQLLTATAFVRLATGEMVDARESCVHVLVHRV